MGFADGYLNKHAPGNRLILPGPDPNLNLVVVIPCHNESGLLRSLDSLFSCKAESIKVEVIILINASVAAPHAVHQQNINTYRSLKLWISRHPHPFIRFFPLINNNLEEKDAGVGMARKIVMDESIRRFNRIDNPNGIILSLDADVLVRPDYLINLYNHFKSNPTLEGCSVYYEHPLDGQEFSETIYRAISQYELHLRYYVRAIRCTGYPFAYQTVGSCFGVKASAYCRYGGMNRRQGGEDFYFIQKVAQNGRYSDCTTTCIEPSPRPSERVPFGTGPAVMSLSSGRNKSLLTYNPAGFELLGRLFDTVNNFSLSFDFKEIKKHGKPTELPNLFAGKLDQNSSGKKDEKVVEKFLIVTGFEKALEEIINNTASKEAFIKRFWRYFNMFRILKFLHFIRNEGFCNIPVKQAASELLSMMGKDLKMDLSVVELLQIYRTMDRDPISYHLQ